MGNIRRNLLVSRTKSSNVAFPHTVHAALAVRVAGLSPVIFAPSRNTEENRWQPTLDATLEAILAVCERRSRRLNSLFSPTAMSRPGDEEKAGS